MRANYNRPDMPKVPRQFILYASVKGFKEAVSKTADPNLQKLRIYLPLQRAYKHLLLIAWLRQARASYTPWKLSPNGTEEVINTSVALANEKGMAKNLCEKSSSVEKDLLESKLRR